MILISTPGTSNRSIKLLSTSAFLSDAFWHRENKYKSHINRLNAAFVHFITKLARVLIDRPLTYRMLERRYVFVRNSHYFMQLKYFLFFLACRFFLYFAQCLLKSRWKIHNNLTQSRIGEKTKMHRIHAVFTWEIN